MVRIRGRAVAVATMVLGAVMAQVAEARLRANPRTGAYRERGGHAQARGRGARAEARRHAGAHHHRGAHQRTHTSGVGGLHPVARVKLAAALGEMRRRGVLPHMTSAYRSSAHQRQLFRCARSRRCRAARGIYGARPPGSSTHEAGLAVDFAGIAVRGRGRRRHLTRPGAAIVGIMRRHDFQWRYGLRDPAHFELSPTRVGYRSTGAAIAARRQQLARGERTLSRRRPVVQVARGRLARLPLQTAKSKRPLTVAVRARPAVAPVVVAMRAKRGVSARNIPTPARVARAVLASASVDRRAAPRGTDARTIRARASAVVAAKLPTRAPARIVVSRSGPPGLLARRGR
jgi:D-alanyl-D-alanine carboxypeptidase